jgi:hypothetical protein
MSFWWDGRRGFTTEETADTQRKKEGKEGRKERLAVETAASEG